MDTNKPISLQVTNEQVQESQLPSSLPEVKRNYWKLSFFIVLSLWLLSVIVTGVYFNKKASRSSKEAVQPVEPTPSATIDKKVFQDETYIFFQGKKVSLGDTFNFSPEDSCVEDTTATLSAVAKDSITFKIKEWNWKNDLNTSIEEITDYVVHDKDCIVARPKCMDVGYKYCFSLSTVDSIHNVTYELESWSTMPRPSD